MKLIPLTRGMFTKVDDSDYEWLCKFKWGYWIGKGKRTGYALHAAYVPRPDGKKGKPKIFRMHRLIMNPPEKLLVDHIDGDGLNNQRCNLRIATHTQNSANCHKRRKNKSGYLGVTWIADEGVWYAQISFMGHKHHLGGFKNIIDAAKARDAAALEYYGEFATLNFPLLERT